MSSEVVAMCLTIFAPSQLEGRKIVDPLDQLQYFSWWGYGFAAIVYTALVFRSELSKEEGPLIFSKQNSRTLTAILVSHVAFLTILFALLRTASFLLTALPDWMTDTFRARGTHVSIADLSFILLVLLMHLIERRWLYVESEESFHDPESKSPQPSTPKRE